MAMLQHRNSHSPGSAHHSWSGTISPVVTPFSCVSSTFYPRAYFYLRAQKTVMQSVERSLDALQKIGNPADQSAISVFQQILTTLLNAEYANIFQYSQGAVDEIKTCLSQQLTPQVERLGYSLLSSVLAVSRLLTLVSYNSASSIIPEEALVETVPEAVSPMKRPERRPKIVQSPSKDTLCMRAPERHRRLSKGLLSGSCDNFNDNNFVVCRICEKRVPLVLIEAHSRSCVLAYESSKTMVSIEDRMRKLQALAKQTIMRTKWPGNENSAVSTILPVVHCVVLLDRAIAADPSNDSAADELDLICESLMPIALSLFDQEAAGILKKAANLVSEKLKTAAKLTHAMDVIHRTSLTPEGIGNLSVAQTTIADFQFINRISSGAYARVFLARKKTTGDIYAVKVLPKTEVRQKNEVRRVLVEKDILLKMSSPFMIKFCMFSCLQTEAIYNC